MNDAAARRPGTLHFLFTFAKLLALSAAFFLALDLLVNREGLDFSSPSTFGPWLSGRLENLRFLLPVGPAVGVALVYWMMSRARANRR